MVHFIKKIFGASGSTTGVLAQKICADSIVPLLGKAVTTAVVTGTITASTPILLTALGLFSVHTFITHLKDDDNEQVIANLQTQFSSLKGEANSSFKKLWKTETRVLEEGLDIKLGLKEHRKEAKELKKLCKNIFEQMQNKESSLESITESITISAEGIKELSETVKANYSEIITGLKDLAQGQEVLLHAVESSEEKVLEAFDELKPHLSVNKNTQPVDPKRENDIKRLTEYLSQIDSYEIDNFDTRYCNGIITAPLLEYYWEGLAAVYSSSDFHLFENNLLGVLEAFHISVAKALSFGDIFVINNCGDYSFHHYAEDDRIRDFFTKASLVKPAFLELVSYVRENYFPDVDPRQTSQAARSSYCQFQKDMQTLYN